jgi:hypothetical protein
MRASLVRHGAERHGEEHLPNTRTIPIPAIMLVLQLTVIICESLAE